MALAAPIGFNLIRPHDWMVKNFSLFITTAFRITGVNTDIDELGAPNKARIRSVFDTFVKQVQNIPELIPFLVDKVSHGNDQASFLLVYRKILTTTGRVDYRLVSTYSYRKNKYETGTLPLSDLTFDITFFIGKNLSQQVPLSSIHSLKNEIPPEPKKTVRVEKKAPIQPEVISEPVKPRRIKLVSKESVQRKKEEERIAQEAIVETPVEVKEDAVVVQEESSPEAKERILYVEDRRFEIEVIKAKIDGFNLEMLQELNNYITRQIAYREVEISVFKNDPKTVKEKLKRFLFKKLG